MTETPLKIARKALGKTALEVSKAIGIDQGYYSRIEAAGRCSPDYAEKIVRHFSRRGAQLTELHVLYPHRYMPQSKRKRAAVKRATAS